MKYEKPIDKAVRVFREHGGVMRTSQALEAGIHPGTLYAMRDSQVLERLARGLYRLADLPPLENPDLTTVALKVPQGVICLISALDFHDLTAQIPHQIDLALPRGAEPPWLEHPPLRIFRFSPRSYLAGVETHQIDDVPIRVYGPEKTIADMFKYRNKLGLDLALEALQTYLNRGRPDLGQIHDYARIDRVANIMRPYLEALL
ncbi:MAG: type IV toxin-antitoxin system AbiEi family antitoxin domain-containing protein [Anaerolineales bacterium]|nr:type IV toxin-antitoxin system AbiEi family antitoxin domain-containing protein [Anaerolineales bacterium]